MKKYLLIAMFTLYTNSCFANKYSSCHVNEDDNLNFSSDSVGYYIIREDQKMDSIASKLFGSEILKNNEKYRELNKVNGFKNFFYKGEVLLVPISEVQIGYNANRFIVFNDCQIDLADDFPPEPDEESELLEKNNQ